MKRIAVINDISGFGRCSLTVALPIISAMGIECCPVPTAILSNQTGYNSFYCYDFTEHLPSYIDEWKKSNTNFDGILTGYIASESQCEIIDKFIDDFKASDTIVLVDPVMGDDGSAYVTFTPSLCEKIKKLSKKAHIITPNLTELSILSDIPYETLKNDLSAIEKCARALLSDTTQYVVVTGIRHEYEISTMAISKESGFICKNKAFGDSFSGTGDIFANIICAGLVKGMELEKVVKLATDFLQVAIKDTYKADTPAIEGVNFQKYLEMLYNA